MVKQWTVIQMMTWKHSSTVMRNLFKNTQTLASIIFFPWIFKWCVSTANFFPWPSLKEHCNSLQWEKLDLFDHVTNISFIQKHDLSVSPCHADVRGSPSSLWFGPLEFAKFSLALFIERYVLILVSILAQLKKCIFLLLLFLEVYFMFSFYFWMAH